MSTPVVWGCYKLVKMVADELVEPYYMHHMNSERVQRKERRVRLELTRIQKKKKLFWELGSTSLPTIYMRTVSSSYRVARFSTISPKVCLF